MTRPDGIAAPRRDGEYVVKVLNERHPAGPDFVAAAQCAGGAGMRAYLSVLRVAGVALAPELSVIAERPLAVRHRWVSGPVLLHQARTNSTRFVDAVVEIAGWVRELADTDARLDTNLANFCLARDQVVLVDVLPPLIPSLRLESSNLFDLLFAALCFDTEVTLDALIGYAARALLDLGGGVAAADLDALAQQLPPGVATIGAAPFPASWFRARAELALAGLGGQVAPEVVHEFFAVTSVRVFRDLPEAHRTQRVRQVRQIMTKRA